MNYSFGFSWKGLLVFLLPMIPNLFYFLIPVANKSVSTANKSNFLDLLEHASQAIFIFMLIFVVSKKASEVLCTYTFGMVILLLFYYVLWIIYFTGNANLVILLGLAILPVVYFILSEFWLHNYLAIIPTTFFGIVHVIITYRNYP
jgi:hypothetical protein